MEDEKKKNVALEKVAEDWCKMDLLSKVIIIWAVTGILTSVIRAIKE